MRHFAADVGGTLTDLVLIEIDPVTGTGSFRLGKVSSRATGPAEGLAQGIRRLTEMVGIKPVEIGPFVHGFTIGAGTFLTRRPSSVM